MESGRIGIRIQKGPKINGERIERAYIHGPVSDVHTHPRIFDSLLPEQPEIPNGKAGLKVYSETAIRGGISQILMMMNESVRVPDPNAADGTSLIPFPLSKEDRLWAAANVAATQSKIPAGIICGVDPEVVGIKKLDSGEFDMSNVDLNYLHDFFRSRAVLDFSAALKMFGDESTGGYNLPLEVIGPSAGIFHEHNGPKPTVLHLEGENVGKILSEWPADRPVHVAHVSTKQELEAVIEAIEDGKDVTCEATPHHLFLTNQTPGCYKPGPNTKEDQKFLWDNLDYIKIFASDCAPHRRLDKETLDGQPLEKPAPGVTNHDVMMALYWGAVLEGRLTADQLYDRLVLNPARRFNLPFDSTIVSEYLMGPANIVSLTAQTQYGVNIFKDSPEDFPLAGYHVSTKKLGRTVVRCGILSENVRPGYGKLMRF